MAKFCLADLSHWVSKVKVSWYDWCMDFTECAEIDCSNPARTASLCPKHYARQQRGSEARKEISEQGECRVSHCELPAITQTGDVLCQPHYQLKYRGFDPEMRILRKTPTKNHQWDMKCLLEGCPRKAQSKGFCNYHRKRIAMGVIEGPEGHDIDINPECAFPECDNRTTSMRKEYCHSHMCQLYEGRELTPLRSYGKYVEGKELCGIGNCKSLAITRTMCKRHFARASTYGLSAGELAKLESIAECENPGCSEAKNLHIDHDHDTGKVRGMLCSSCNTTLGRMKEDVERIRGLAEYKLMHS